MPEAPVAEFVSKRLELFNSLEKVVGKVSADMKELKYQVNQYEAKVKTFEGQILAKKAEIAELDEAIRRKKIDVAGSFNNLRDDLNAREQAFIKREAELSVLEQNVRDRAEQAEALIVKAERALPKNSKAKEPAFSA